MSIGTGNGGAAVGCPCGCGAAEKAHCWKESDWEESSAARALRAENEHLRSVIAGLEQGNRELHQGIAKQKATNATLRADNVRLRAENDRHVQRLRAEEARREREAMSGQPAVVTEDVDHLGTQWGVSFDGSDPAPEHHVRVTSRDDADRLKSLVDRMRAEVDIREDGVQQAKGDVEALRAVIVRANNALFSVGPDIQDAEHTIECHAATEAYRRLAVGANEAWGVLTAAVADMVESESK